MKRSSFLKSLGIIAGSGMILPEAKVEKLSLPKHTSNADMSIGVNGVERMRIKSDGTHLFISSSGNVGISNTSPSTRLVIS
jgi:hypothetical protein